MDLETKERFSEMEQHFAQLYATKADLADEFGKLRHDIAKLESTLLKWFMATALSMTAGTFTIVRLLG